MMKKLFIFLLFGTISVADINVMVSNLDCSLTISKQELADLYLGKTNTIQGIKLTPIDNADKESYKEFYQKVVNKTPKQLHSYWLIEMNRGSKRPPQRLSDRAIQKLFQTEQRVIAYALSDLNGEVVMRIE